jgi:Glyceraldehyde-3-phosphate dehydrogenase/erythrose-4-phosphate dehydrogenase
MAIKVAINGFGRIGRMVFRSIVEREWDGIEVVAINDPTDIATSAYLLKHDSNYGKFPCAILIQDEYLLVNDRKIKYFTRSSPELLPWKELKVDAVVEASGKFGYLSAARRHLAAGAKKVIVTALPGLSVEYTKIEKRSPWLAGRLFRYLHRDSIPIFVMGVNEEGFNPNKHTVVSNGSCGMNASAPIIKSLHHGFGVQGGFMTITHGPESHNHLLDTWHRNPRMGRACQFSMIPVATHTGKCLPGVVPGFRTPLPSFVIKVPVAAVSMLDLTLHLKKKVRPKDILAVLKKESERSGAVIGVSEEPLVSIDYKKSPLSCTVDGEMIFCQGKMVKLMAWFDNEWGYSNRVVDLVRHIGKKDEENK